MKTFIIVLFIPLTILASDPYALPEVEVDAAYTESSYYPMVEVQWDIGFTNRFDIYWSTNGTVWSVAGYDIRPDDFETNAVVWRSIIVSSNIAFKSQNICIDCDQDGIPDCREIALFKTDPTKRDTDGDSIPDLHELKQRTDPVNEQNAWDTDIDGIPDAVEIEGFIIPDEQQRYSFKQAKLQAAARGGQIVRIDEDSIEEIEKKLLYEPRIENSYFWVKSATNVFELIAWGNAVSAPASPHKAGFLMEVSGLNPKSWDTDDDGLSDAEEVFVHESNPFRKDTDRDGISDYEEVKRDLHPVDARNLPVRYGPSSYRPNPYYEETKKQLFEEQVAANRVRIGIEPPKKRPEEPYDKKFRQKQTLIAPNTYQRITYRVRDMDSGLPVTNAVMRVWRRNSRDGQNVPVDTDGTLEYLNKNPEMGRGLKRSFSAPEYYRTRTAYVFESVNRLSGRQLPWNPVLEVPLCRIRNPVEMKTFNSPHNMKFPVNNQPIEFDAVVGDWLPPYGTGLVCDFVLCSSNNVPNDPMVRNVLSFPNPLDGIQEYFPDEKKQHSEFIFPYDAPLEGYQSKLEKSETTGVNPRTHNFKKGVNYIFRIRSQMGESGNITALHGRINGELEMGARVLKFNYVLNTNRMSRSLEHKKD
jgi:hypothetical protein